MTIAKAYLQGLKLAYEGDIDYTGGTVKCMLTTSSYVPNQDTHDYKSDVTNEITGTGYTAGGVTLTTKTIEINTSTNTVRLKADDPTWSTATFTCRYAVFYLDTGTAATSPLISYMDFESNQSPSAENFIIELPAAGILQNTAA